MNEQQKIWLLQSYHDLVPQEPTLEEMDIAFKATLLTLITSHPLLLLLNISIRFRTGLMPNKKGQSLKQIQEKESNLKDGSLDQGNGGTRWHEHLYKKLLHF